jgi:hypothetical protein
MNFEGSLILEELASRGLVEDFYAAVDADDLPKIVSILRSAGIDDEKIREVLKEIT